MTCEHLRPLLDEVRSMHLLFQLTCHPLQFKCGRMTALTKPDGGVRGIVSGDVFEAFGCSHHGPTVGSCRQDRHVTHTSTRCPPEPGCECIAHVLQVDCAM